MLSNTNVNYLQGMVKDYSILQAGFDTLIQYIADSDNCQNKNIKKVPHISTFTQSR